MKRDGSRPTKYLLTGDEDPTYRTVKSTLSSISGVAEDSIVFLEVCDYLLLVCSE